MLSVTTADDCGAADNYDVIVLGAGISGLVSAAILSKEGCRNVLVVDEYVRVGGNLGALAARAAGGSSDRDQAEKIVSQVGQIVRGRSQSTDFSLS